MFAVLTQLRPTVCDSMDCSQLGYSVHGDSPEENTGMGCHALLQGIFPAQQSNPGLQHCWHILYHLSQQGSPHKEVHWLLHGIFPIQGLNPSLPHCRPAEASGKPKNTGVSSLSLLQGIFPIGESSQGLLHCRRILYQLSYQGIPNKHKQIIL